jgi:hypothetical protein
MSDLLPSYLEHLRERIRSGGVRSAALPPDLARLCAEQPHECLDLIVRALQEPVAPEQVRAIGDQLLEDLLNGSSAALASEVPPLLRTNRRFRQAFALGDYASVDPALFSEWIDVFQELGTSKKAERRRLAERGDPPGPLSPDQSVEREVGK